MPWCAFSGTHAAPGWNVPSFAPWLTATLDEASIAAFGNPARTFGEGGTIPFMGMLGAMFPDAQFVITGVLVPGSNAHGPNEFLHLPTAGARHRMRGPDPRRARRNVTPAIAAAAEDDDTAEGIAVTASEVSEVRHRSGRGARVAALLLTGPPGACHSGRRRINRKGRSMKRPVFKVIAPVAVLATLATAQMVSAGTTEPPDTTSAPAPSGESILDQVIARDSVRCGVRADFPRSTRSTRAASRSDSTPTSAASSPPPSSATRRRSSS